MCGFQQRWTRVTNQAREFLTGPGGLTSVRFSEELCRERAALRRQRRIRGQIRGAFKRQWLIAVGFDAIEPGECSRVRGFRVARPACVLQALEERML